MNKKRCPFLLVSLLVLASLLLGGLITAGPAEASLAASSWPMFRHGLSHTGLSPYAGPHTDHLKWTYHTNDWVWGSPAIGNDGTVYVGSEDGNVYAIKPDGTKRWSYAEPPGSYIDSSPAVGSDGTVYVGGMHFYAINPDGTQKWAFTSAVPGAHSFSSSPAVGGDGTVCVGCDDDRVYAINPDGTQKWAFATGALFSVQSSPAVGSDGTVYVGSGDHMLYAIKPDGTAKWASPFATGSGIVSSPAIGSDGTIYVGSTDDYVYAVNPDGTQKWAFATGDEVDSSPAVGSDGTIYIGSTDNNLYALRPDGSKKWSFATRGAIYWSSPAIGSDGTVYIGSTDGYVYAIDPAGSLKWSYLTGGPIALAAAGSFHGKFGAPGYGTIAGIVNSSPAIGNDGTVYIGAFDGNLYAFQDVVQTTTPTVDWTSPPPGSSGGGGANSTVGQGPSNIANLVVQSASLSEGKATPGVPITVTANVVNTGTADGSALIRLYVNGREESHQGVALSSSSKTSVKFTLRRDEPGTYTVYVGSVPAGSFTVDAFADPNLILYASLALLALAFTVGVLLTLRRRVQSP